MRIREEKVEGYPFTLRTFHKQTEYSRFDRSIDLLIDLIVREEVKELEKGRMFIWV